MLPVVGLEERDRDLGILPGILFRIPGIAPASSASLGMPPASPGHPQASPLHPWTLLHVTYNPWGTLCGISPGTSSESLHIPGHPPAAPGHPFYIPLTSLRHPLSASCCIPSCMPPSSLGIPPASLGYPSGIPMGHYHSSHQPTLGPDKGELKVRRKTSPKNVFLPKK